MSNRITADGVRSASAVPAGADIVGHRPIAGTKCFGHRLAAFSSDLREFLLRQFDGDLATENPAVLRLALVHQSLP